MTQLTLCRDKLAEDFERFDQAHPEVYRHFCRFAAEVLAAGRDHYSSDAICHRIRWHVDIECRDDEGFKINDHFTALYARKWLGEHPERAGFFSTRGRRGEL